MSSFKSKRNTAAEPRKQPTPQELRDRLLDFIRRKFYETHNVEFSKDRPRLLSWVVLWPARWLNERGVTLPADQYAQLLEEVLMDAIRLGNTGNITYLPAYLAKVVQSHFQHHGDEIYEQAKSMRLQIEQVMLLAGRLPQPAPDPVRDLAAASKLLKLAPQKKPIDKAQLTLL